MSNSFTYLVSGFAAIGGFLFGYDIGVISGVLEIDDFKEIFQLNPSKKGLIVSLLLLGCFVGALFSGWCSDKLGRKRTILLASAVFSVGAALQTAAYGLGEMIPGRLISGFSVGILSMVVPLYQSELSSPNIRGRLVSLQQWAITIGIAVSFWINYVCSLYLPPSINWRLPLGLQIAPSLLLLVGSFFLPYSPRWLIDQGRDDEGREVLARLRSSGDLNHELVTEEYNEIKEASEKDRLASNSFKDLFVGSISRRTYLGIFIQMFQQLTGINSVMYYAPQIFQQAGFDTSASLLATAINGIVNMLSTIPAILWVDRWGRRATLISGAVVMGIGMAVVGIVIATTGTAVHDGDEVKITLSSLGASYSVIVFVYVFVAGFAYSWGPVAWIYPSEIFPMRVRSKGISVTTASNWLFNTIVGQVSPILMSSITWGLYIIFACFCVIMALSIWWFYPETRGYSLEDMDLIFAEGANPRNPQIEKPSHNSAIDSKA